jgi:predicted transcriptional regulator
MQHRGEIIKEAVYKSGLSITELAKRIGKSRRWVYLMFENNSVSLDVILQIGTIIHHNFTKDIEEFEPIKKAFDKSSNNSDNVDFSGENWKNKYLQLLEEYNALLKEKLNSSEN